MDMHLFRKLISVIVLRFRKNLRFFFYDICGSVYIIFKERVANFNRLGVIFLNTKCNRKRETL